MALPHQRTWQKHRVGHFIATVQLDAVADGHGMEQQRQLAEVTRQLIDLMDSHHLPVTWAVSDPAYSAATPFILRSAVEHELAILGDSNWLGPTAGRTRFARELARRVSQARAAGIELNTLVPRAASVTRHFDLVVKQRIQAIAGVEANQSSRQVPVPRALHYGVWELPETARLPIRSAWWLGKWSLWRQIRRAARAAATYHLVIDAPAVLDEGRSAEKTIAWLMRRIAEWRNRGLICVETLGASAKRLAAVPVAAPQHSILRRAA